MKAITINLNEFFQSLPAWGVESTLGYQPISTFWQDFSIADAAYKLGEHSGLAVIRTFREAFEEWKSDAKMVTELSMVLNHKIWYHYDAANDAEKKGRCNLRDFHMMLSVVYDTLWKECDGWCRENLTGGDKEYYYQVTD